jgi:hypothetical protein
VGLLGNLKDVIDEDALTKGLAEKVVPALGKVLKELVRETVDSVVGLTVTVGRKKPGGV